MISVRMPKIGSGEVGTVVRWEALPGDEVERGDMLAEVETEKANVVVEAPQRGRLAQILVAAGLEVPVGTVIAEIEEEGER
jgi:pyruvate/2-oxoglutarate dehydrogenase complex dihydrolipoamide acyltransferase (E2) component